MLSFDIETTGLAITDTITTACAYDPENNIHKTFIFPLKDNPMEFIKLLDAAPALCAFNGAQFDIPFIQKEWGIPNEQVAKWRLKLFDIYETCKIVFKQGFSLNQLLLANNIHVKTGTGKEAIVLAAQSKWLELGDYCMQDTIKTYKVSTLPLVCLPLFNMGYKVHLSNPGTRDQKFILQ
jgi:hypothetical protein